MKNRSIPYGYTMKNGRMVIEKTEAEIIRAIFTKYIAGASLKDIAGELTNLQVPYSERTTEWGKARIARIIENSKYIGDATFDSIIDDKIYGEALSCKNARHLSAKIAVCESMEIIRNRVKCGKCGSAMVRSTENRNKIKQSWVCQNLECKCKVRINDDELLKNITVVMNKILLNPDLLKPPIAEKETQSIAVTRMMNEINRELERSEPNDDFILAQIFSIASEQYANSDVHIALEFERLIKQIFGIPEQENFNGELFKLLISHLILYEDGKINLRTKTNTII